MYPWEMMEACQTSLPETPSTKDWKVQNRGWDASPIWIAKGQLSEVQRPHSKDHISTRLPTISNKSEKVGIRCGGSVSNYKILKACSTAFFLGQFFEFAFGLSLKSSNFLNKNFKIFIFKNIFI